MKPQQKVDFLRRKLALLRPHAGATYLNVMLELVQKMENNLTTVPSSGFKDIDRELERKIAEAIPDEAAVEFRLTLAREFGVSGLAENPRAVIAKILKRGKLLNEVEAKILQDYLSGDFQGYLCPPDQQKVLNGMLAGFDLPGNAPNRAR